MIKRLREHGRLTSTGFLLTLSLYCFGLSILRSILTRGFGYLFLNWNLFLAFIPWLLTSFAVVRDMRSKAAILVIMAVWLLFFPNSPYILTDLIHISVMRDAMEWLDLIIVLSYSWAGLCFGFLSLFDIEHFLHDRFGMKRNTVTVLSIIMVYLGAFGVYIGRFLRWNSWDIFGNPVEILTDLVGPFTDPFNNIRFWGFIALMGTLLNFMYFGFKLLSAKSTAPAGTPPA